MGQERPRQLPLRWFLDASPTQKQESSCPATHSRPRPWGHPRWLLSPLVGSGFLGPGAQEKQQSREPPPCPIRGEARARGMRARVPASRSRGHSCRGAETCPKKCARPFPHPWAAACLSAPTPDAYLRGPRAPAWRRQRRQLCSLWVYPGSGCLRQGWVRSLVLAFPCTWKENKRQHNLFLNYAGSLSPRG